MSRHLDQLSIWIIWTHDTGNHYVKRSSCHRMMSQWWHVWYVTQNTYYVAWQSLNCLRIIQAEGGDNGTHLGRIEGLSASACLSVTFSSNTKLETVQTTSLLQVDVTHDFRTPQILLQQLAWERKREKWGATASAIHFSVRFPIGLSPLLVLHHNDSPARPPNDQNPPISNEIQLI